MVELQSRSIGRVVHLSEAVSIQLANKGAQVVMLEIGGKDFGLELLGVMDDKVFPRFAPRYNVISTIVSDKFVCLSHERSWFMGHVWM